MEFKVKLLFVCAIIAVASASPKPQEPTVNVETAAAGGEAVAPSQPAIISTINGAIQSFTNVINSVTSMANNAYGSATTSYQNVMDSANSLYNNITSGFQQGIATAVSNVNQGITQGINVFRPSSAAVASTAAVGAAAH